VFYNNGISGLMQQLHFKTTKLSAKRGKIWKVWNCCKQFGW